MTLIATILGSSLAFLDVTVVIVALPTIEKDLNLGLAGEQWIYLSYSLALASLYLVAGAVGDRRGRREVFTAGVAVFALASLLAAVAPNGGVLIAARTLQGIGGAFVTTTAWRSSARRTARTRAAPSASGRRSRPSSRSAARPSAARSCSGPRGAGSS